MRYLLSLVLIFIFSGNVYAAHIHPEKYYQKIWCSQNVGTMEYRLNDKTRVDCLTKDYAIEVGFVDHKYEDIGQSLYYSLITGKPPGIVTIIDGDKNYKEHLAIEKALCAKYGIRLWIVTPDNLY